jgi:hypothetical protein
MSADQQLGVLVIKHSVESGKLSTWKALRVNKGLLLVRSTGMEMFELATD